MPLRLTFRSTIPDQPPGGSVTLLLDIFTDEFLMAGATSLRFTNEEAIYEHTFRPGTYILGISAYGSLPAPNDYAIDIASAALSPCEATNVVHTELEGATAGDNDVILFTTAGPTVPTDDAPELTGLTLGPNDTGCIDGTIVDALLPEGEDHPFFATGDRDTYQITLGPGVTRLDTRIQRLDGETNIHGMIHAPGPEPDSFVEVDYLDLFTGRASDERGTLLSPPAQDYLVTVSSWLDVNNQLPSSYRLCFCAQ